MSEGSLLTTLILKTGREYVLEYSRQVVFLSISLMMMMMMIIYSQAI